MTGWLYSHVDIDFILWLESWLVLLLSAWYRRSLRCVLQAMRYSSAWPKTVRSQYQKPPALNDRLELAWTIEHGLSDAHMNQELCHIDRQLLAWDAIYCSLQMCTQFWRVIIRLRASGTAWTMLLALLDDVNENLATFDTKLLVMREDIAAIEVGTFILLAHCYAISLNLHEQREL